MNDQQTSNKIGENIAAAWLEQFEAVGGFVINDGQTVTLGQKLLGYSQADQTDARKMISELAATPATTLH